MSNLYCTYFTTYLGDQSLPPFYIGSTSVKQIENGYKGSVCSKKFRKLWEIETKYFPELFDVRIISRHATREEAFAAELQLQKDLNVVESQLYVNRAYATKRGCFGQTGENAWNYGKTKETDESVARQSKKLTGRNKLPPEIVEQVIAQRDAGKLYQEIHEWISSQGITNIVWTSLHKIYKREHHKYSNKPMVIGGKGRTKEQYSFLADLSNRMIGKTKETDERVAKAAQTLKTTLKRKNETIDN